MTLTFYKYHGTGNDFILIDDTNGKIGTLGSHLIEKMCHRRFGIGADGLMVLRNKEGFDFDMDFYNSDGKPGSMCGNGGRCIVAFAHDLGLIKDNTIFWAPDGAHEARYYSEEKISLKMQDVNGLNNTKHGLFLDTGSPHLIVEEAQLENTNVYGLGKTLRNHQDFAPHGTNVNFIQKKDKSFDISTYERGVEDVTLSCGTGTVAAALSLHHNSKYTSPMVANTKGGKLSVYFKNMGSGKYTDIWLEGPAKKVFKGTYNTDN